MSFVAPTTSMHTLTIMPTLLFHLTTITDCRAAALLPDTIDTPDNRKFMPKAAAEGKWTPPDDMSAILRHWAEGNDRPPSGSLVLVHTNQGDTSVSMHPRGVI